MTDAPQAHQRRLINVRVEQRIAPADIVFGPLDPQISKHKESTIQKKIAEVAALAALGKRDDRISAQDADELLERADS